MRNTNGISINWSLVSAIEPLAHHISSYVIFESVTMYIVLTTTPAPALTSVLQFALARFNITVTQLAESNTLMLATTNSVSMGSVLYALEFKGTRFERLRKIQELARIHSCKEKNNGNNNNNNNENKKKKIKRKKEDDNNAEKIKMLVQILVTCDNIFKVSERGIDKIEKALKETTSKK